MSKTARFQFSKELYDYLKKDAESWVEYEFSGKPSIKDAIEAIGVPHVEVGEIRKNDQEVTFDDHLFQDDKIRVFRKYVESRDQWEFVLDVHLGKLARLLRLLGFDCLYRNDLSDEEIIKIADMEGRVVLTRDIELLKNNLIKEGYWLRSQENYEQLEEVIDYFRLGKQIRPFTRCMVCNGKIEQVAKGEIESELEEQTRKDFDEFYRCTNCAKIYWKGSHYERMVSFLKHLDVFIDN